jgi:DNA-binding transcriptional ArsR family regulator
VVTEEGRELLGGCIVVPIPDPLRGEWTTLYGRGMRTPRHCYLPGPLRGVLNFQAAKASEEVILAESILDALSFHQAGIAIAIPLYGTNGFTPDHADLLKRERVKRVILALDGDAAGRKATMVVKDKLTSLGIAVRVMPYPPNLKDPNEVLVSRNGDAGLVFRRLLAEAEPRPVAPLRERPATNENPGEAVRRCLDEAEPRGASPGPDPALSAAGAVPAAQVPPAVDSVSSLSSAGQLVLVRDGVTYRARVQAPLLGRLRATVKVERGTAFHVDTLDLYASRSRSEFGKRAAKVLGIEAGAVESALLALLVEAEKVSDEGETKDEASAKPTLTDAEREEGLALLKRPDLLDQVAKDVDALGFVGEETTKRLLYLVAISRKLPDPLSAIVLSQSGAGKSGLTEVIERLTPPEDVVLLTRLTPQSLYYTEPGFLDRKLVIVEERYGSVEADYSIRVLQSRGKLIAAAPVKDPQTGNMRTKVFTVEARCAFIEATTASAVNHENATRCFELTMDESPEQTKRIHERQRLMRTERGLELRREAEAITRRHWNAQRLLEPLPVVIPFADKLSFPSSWMRTRRDHARFLNLIEVSAFLHQHQRERRGGAIVASVADYAVAYALASSVLTETLSDLKRPLREAYERVHALCEGGEGGVTRREIREALQMPDSTVRNWLAELVSLEYVEADGVGVGRTTRYRLTGRGPKGDVVLGLLSPDELKDLLR